MISLRADSGTTRPRAVTATTCLPVDSEINLLGGLGNDTLVEDGNANFTLTSSSLVGLGTDVLMGVESAQLYGWQRQQPPGCRSVHVRTRHLGRGRR